jgi:hypothetical protein
VRKPEIKKVVLAVAIIIILPILLFSYSNATSSWQPRAYGDPTPAGIITKVTAAPDSKVFVGLGMVVPSPRYTSCGIILVPPGEQGGDSSGPAKLLEIESQGCQSYNSTVHLEILSSNSSEYQELNSRNIEMGDSLVVNCSIMGNIPEGRWTIFLMFLEAPITSATWIVNDTLASNQPLSFAQAGVADPMMYYGLVHSPQYGYFWTALLFFSSVALILLVFGLYSTIKYEKKGE